MLIPENTLTWKSYLADPRNQRTTPVHVLSSTPDVRLVNTWLDLSELATAINLAHQTRRKLSPENFQEALISVMYRLLHLDYGVDTKLETLRLSMLSFSSMIFLNFGDKPLNFSVLAERFRNAARLLASLTGGQTVRLTFWMVVVNHLACLNVPGDHVMMQEQLFETSRVLGITSWVEARQILKSFIWIDVVNDKAGKRLFNTLKDQR